MQEQVNGVKEVGDWQEVVRSGEEIAEVVDDEAFEDWRPRMGDELEEDIHERTVEHASTGELMGSLQELVYDKLMVPALPYMLHTDTLLAVLSQTGTFINKEEYSLEVNFSEKEVRDEVQELA